MMRMPHLPGLSVRPVVLVIRDGWGYREERRGNAVTKASTPVTDRLLREYPHCMLDTSGEAVGFPRGFLGTSEAGHLNIGAGRLVKQEFKKVTELIDNKKFFTHPKLLRLADNCRKHDSAFHIMGLVQDAGVHAHISHLFALLDFARKQKLQKVHIHFFSDGRDTHPFSARRYLAQLEEKLAQVKVGRIQSISGRYYAMDRDNRWERIQRAYDTIVWPEKSGVERIDDIGKYIISCHKNGVGDEFIPPAALGDYEGTGPHDSMVFFDYRQDRAIQLTKALIEPGFREFQTKRLSLSFLGLTRYYDEFKDYMIPPFEIRNTLGEVLSKAGLRQLRISETEKFKHVTSFFNAKVEKPFPKEDRRLIPSPKVATYDLMPEMRTREITDAVEELLLKKRYDAIIMNYPSPDMVGHTGNMDAAVIAVEAVDECTGRLCRLVLEANGAAIVTSDHGNCEEMIGEVQTSHTLNPVQCILVSRFNDLGLRKRGILADIAPTMLQLLGIGQPKEMTGKSLLAFKRKGFRKV